MPDHTLDVVMRNEEHGGYFSRNLLSLQIQLQTLLDGAGGSKALELLDSLSSCNESERDIVLSLFGRALKRLQEANIRFSSLRDEQLEEFENVLYEELVEGMTIYSEGGRELSPQNVRSLSVLAGGKSKQISKLPTRKRKEQKTLCLEEARKKTQGAKRK